MYLDEFRTYKSPTTGLTIERVRHCYIPNKDRFFQVDNTDKVAEILEEALDISMLPEEYIWALAVDSRCHTLGLFEISHGSIDKVYFDAKDVLKRMLLINASGFMLVHNHPSGIPEPSKEDKEVAEKIKKAGDAIGMKLVDFLIMSNENDYFSFRKEGLLS